MGVNRTKRKGVITIANVTGNQVSASGYFLYLDIHFRGKVYKTSIDKACSSCVGKYFFVKIDPDAITNFPILYENVIVPSCIIDSQQDYNGWDSLPTCK